ncbi:MAG: Sua5/YciO/YrdC/YwlC family protein, partial [Lysobacterales bacterium]
MTDLRLLDTASAVEQLREGRVIAYPTEAVYGLGCDPRNEVAACDILRLKGRQAKAGFVLIASRFSQL